METTKENQIEKAAKHFETLYADEIKAGEATSDSMYEWWVQTVDQYSELERDDFDKVEQKINSK